jgi:hypothetical protein
MNGPYDYNPLETGDFYDGFFKHIEKEAIKKYQKQVQKEKEELDEAAKVAEFFDYVEKKKEPKPEVKPSTTIPIVPEGTGRSFKED